MKEIFTKEEMLEFRLFKPCWNSAKEDLEHFIQSKEKQYPEGIYEIIAGNGRIYTADTQLKGKYCTANGTAPFYSAKDLLNHNEYYKIHSVKNSKGEVFAVGDKCYYLISDCNQGEPFKITKFEVLRGILYAFNDNSCSSPACVIDSLIKVVEKPIIFTTEDGVSIYENNEVTIVNTQSFSSHTYTTTSYSRKVPHILNFSTKEKAEQYIKENKPKFSEKQVKDALKSTNFNHMPKYSPHIDWVDYFYKKLGI